MSVLNENQLLGAPASTSQYQISRSLRFNSADSAYLSRTPASAGNRKTWTWSGWVKVADAVNRQPLFGAALASATNYHTVELSGGRLSIYWYAGAWTAYAETNALYRDCGAWMHVVAVFDTTQSVAADRTKIYVNGVQQTLTVTNSPALNADGMVNATTASIPGLTHYTGSNSVDLCNSYLAEIHFIDGQALTPASFGETDATTGQWIPKAYTGTYGTNGFKLNFSNNSAATATTLGADSSGNGNNWTPNNLSVTAGAGNDSLVDTPTSYGTDTGVGGEVRGNYCTWNPLNSTSGLTPANGNLELGATSGVFQNSRGTLALNNGKFYWETVVASVTTYQHWGIVPTDTPLETGGSEALGQTNIPNSVAIVCGTGNIIENSNTLSAGSGSLSANTIIGHAFDGTTGKYWISINGTWRTGNPSTGTTPLTTVSLSRTWLCGVSEASSQTLVANFGQRPFAYTAPSGFKALCDTNLPAPTIVKPSTVMDVKLYTGNASTNTISGLGFSPDFVWIKCRSAANWNNLFDTVRGNTKILYSNATDAELTETTASLTSFNSDGFSLSGSGSSGVGNTNANSATYAAWCWDAGSSTVTNTAGTIQSSVRANASAGFSVVTYTGTLSSAGNATVGHGLGVAPSLIISKSRNKAGVDSGDWFVRTMFLGDNKFLNLNGTGALGDTVSSGGGSNPAATSSVFYVTYNGGSGITGNNYVAYCFAPVAGYSAFGSYTGNGNADGPFVYTGFRPRWVMIKQTTAASSTSWAITDSARASYNVVDSLLYANLSDAEATAGTFVDFLSNGFKIKASTGTWNASAGTYVYAAFAEFPFQYARAR